MEHFKTGLIRALLLFAIFTANYAAATGTPANPIYVDTYATAGNGSSTSPWTGWDTNSSNTWTPGTAYIFRQGWYSYSATPAAWAASNMQLLGQPGTVLKCVGCTGAVVSLVNTSNHPQNIHFENFILDGNGTAAEGLLVNGPGRSEFNDIRIRNVTTTGFHLTTNILNTFTNPKIALAGETSSTIHYMPVTAMLIDGGSSANTIINPVFEGTGTNNYLNLATVTQVGLKMAGTSIQNVIIGGTAESLVTGIALCTDSGDVNCSKNTFTGIDVEGNTTSDIVLGLDGSSSNLAYSNQFSNVIGDSTPATGKVLRITSTASLNQFIGGEYSSIYERGQYNTFMNVGISGTDSAHLDAYFINGTVINMRNLSGGANVTSRMPMNTQVGNLGSGVNNIYSAKTVISSFPTPTTIPISSTSNIYVYDVSAVYVNSSITAALSAGATVSVGYVDGVLPANVTLSGYVDPNHPQSLYIRWAVAGSSTLPPTGNYKIIVTQ